MSGFLRLVLCAVIGAVGANAIAAADFKVLPISMEVSSLAHTEDGRFVILAHQASNQLSVWNVEAQKIEKTIATENPGEILCRGNQAFVANVGAGTIAVLDTDTWQLVNQLEVPTADELYLTAPQGRFFDGRIVVTAFYDRNAKQFALDSNLDRYKEVKDVRASGLVTSSYTGKFCLFKVKYSSYFNAKGSFDAVANGKPLRDYGTNYDNAPMLRQVRENEFWFGGNKVFRGLPPKQMIPEKERFVVPDQNRDCFYAIGPETIACCAIDANFTEWGHVRTLFPKEFDRMRPKPKSGLHDRGDADRQHVAATLNNKTFILVYSPTRGSVYHTRLDAIPERAASKVPAAEKPAMKLAETGEAQKVIGIPPVVAVGTRVESQAVAKKLTKGKFEVIQGPKSIQIDPSGKLQWTPTASEAGQHRIKIRSVIKGKTNFLRFNTSVVADPAMVPDAALVVPVALGASSEFAQLPTAMSISSLAVTEDGENLLLGHKASDKISVWSVSSERVKTTIDCPSPGPILSRGALTFVGCDGEGSIAVIDNKTWKVTKQIDIRQRDIGYMTAPQSKYFDGALVVTSRIDSNDCILTIVDTRRGQSREQKDRFGGEVLRCGYSGKSYITQSHNNGHIDSHGPFSAFVQGRSVHTFGNFHDRAPLIEQVRDNEYWFGDKKVYRGLPPKPTSGEYGRFLIADQNHDVIYAMYPERIECLALDGLMTDLGRARTAYPPEYEATQKRNPGGGGIAITRDGKLHLFVAALEIGNVYYQTLPQFSIPASIENSLLRTSLASAKPHELPRHVAVGQLIEVPLVPEEMQRGYGDYKMLSGPESIQIDRRGNLTWTPTTDDVGRQQVRVNANIRGKVLNLRLSTIVHDPATERAMSQPVEPAPASSSKPTKRVWKDPSGDFTLTAELVEFKSGIVTLKKPDGALIKVPAERLCQEDQDYLAKP